MYFCARRYSPVIGLSRRVAAVQGVRDAQQMVEPAVGEPHLGAVEFLFHQTLFGPGFAQVVLPGAVVDDVAEQADESQRRDPFPSGRHASRIRPGPRPCRPSFRRGAGTLPKPARSPTPPETCPGYCWYPYPMRGMISPRLSNRRSSKPAEGRFQHRQTKALAGPPPPSLLMSRTSASHP